MLVIKDTVRVWVFVCPVVRMHVVCPRIDARMVFASWQVVFDMAESSGWHGTGAYDSMQILLQIGMGDRYAPIHRLSLNVCIALCALTFAVIITITIIITIIITIMAMCKYIPALFPLFRGEFWRTT